jgi:hypothetical protein
LQQQSQNPKSSYHEKPRIYLLLAVFTALGFAFGLAFDGIVSKAYAKTETSTTSLTFPEEADFEVMASGSSSRADYEIVYVYGRKYIIFSSGSDIEVLEY